MNKLGRKHRYTVGRYSNGTVVVLDADTRETVLRIEKERYDALVAGVDAEGRRPELDAVLEAAVRRHESVTRAPGSSRGVIVALAGLAALAHEPAPVRFERRSDPAR